jgi:hypothetical protein
VDLPDVAESIRGHVTTEFSRMAGFCQDLAQGVYQVC